MSNLEEEELEDIIYQMELEACGQEIAEQKKLTFQSVDWSKIINAGFQGEIAEQIHERLQNQDFDYTTVQGGVISNVCFYRPGLGWTSESRPSDIGAQDLPLGCLGKIAQAKFRPKLPGKMMTKAQVQKLGRRTCYDLVERVGDTFFGIFPYDIQCTCCRSYKWEAMRKVQLEPWHEGLMILLEGVEYRAKRCPTIDRIHEGMVWEMAYMQEKWHPIRPREFGKPVQSDIIAQQQVILPMLTGEDTKQIAGKRQMSKVVVLGRKGPHLYNQKGVWDMIGGKQEIYDTTPVAMAQREYEEETGLHPPNLVKVCVLETKVFLVHVFFAKDDRLEGDGDPSLLVSPQVEVWDEFFYWFDPELMSEILTTDQYNWLIKENSQTPSAERERQKIKERKEKKKLLFCKDELPYSVDFFMSDGTKAYLCDHPRYEELVHCQTRKEIVELLTESFFLEKEYGIRVGSSFFAVPVKPGADTMLASYIVRFKMEWKEQRVGRLRTRWIIAWSAYKDEVNLMQRYQDKQVEEWESLFCEFKESRSSQTPEEAKLNGEEIKKELDSFGIFRKGQVYEQKEMVDKVEACPFHYESAIADLHLIGAISSKGDMWVWNM